MVQLKNGDWWFIIMQDRGPIGRVPHLVPVKWVDGWPMLGSGGKDIITYPKPEVGKTYPSLLLPQRMNSIHLRSDFNGSGTIIRTIAVGP